MALCSATAQWMCRLSKVLSIDLSRPSNLSGLSTKRFLARHDFKSLAGWQGLLGLHHSSRFGQSLLQNQSTQFPVHRASFYVHSHNLKMADATRNSEAEHLMEKNPELISSRHIIREEKIPVPWGGHLAVKVWGKPNDHPILALHGWQDNAGTWDRLIPLLPPDFYIVCLDFCGHGFSSHYPTGLMYHYWDHIAHIRLVAAHFKWSRFSILGHSMGGVVGSTFAAVTSQMVEKLAMVDIIKPISTPAKLQPDKSAKAMDTYIEVLKKLEQNPPSYSYETARDRLIAANNGSIDPSAAQILMRRGAKQIENSHYVFSRDLRLVIPSPASYTVEQHAEYAKRVHCPLLLIKAKQGFVYEDKAINDEFVKIYRAASSGGFNYVEVDGTHHVHLVNPENIAALVTEFFSP